MISITFKIDERLRTLDARVQLALQMKLEELTLRLYDKVIDNLSGGILQTKTGQLRDSVHWDTNVRGTSLRGTVYVSPVTEKALALEKGGRRWYTITPVKAQMLHFVAKNGNEVFTGRVRHPPSRKFAYLQRAKDEMQAVLQAEFRAAYMEAVRE